LQYPSFPIQVAIIKEDGSTFDRYIRPSDKWIETYNWDPASQDIHNIPLNTLLDIGKPLKEVAEDLNEFVGDGTVYCDGGLYDIGWCNELYEAAKIKRTFRLGSVTELYEYHAGDKQLWEVKQIAADKLKLKEHDALNDVKIIQLAVNWKRNNYIP